METQKEIQEEREEHMINQKEEIKIRIHIKKGEVKKIKRKFTLMGKSNVIKTLIINEGGRVVVEDEYKAVEEEVKNEISIVIIGDGYSETKAKAIMDVNRESRDSENKISIEAYKFSPHTRIEVKPEVNIKCMNIRSAEHGGKIKQIEGIEKVYLESRGLEMDDIKNLLITSFLNEV